MRRPVRVRRATPPPGMLTFREALIRGADQLSAHPELRPTAFRDATELFLEVMGISRATLMAHPDRRIDREQQALYQRMLERRLRFEPIQYILGRAEFFGLTLRVTPAVLIPRPETEILVEAVAARLNGQNELHILDVGTGSGAIALALAQALPLAQVTAIDLSPEALAVARENAQSLGLTHRIRFLQSDLLAELPPAAHFDCILSNPPYVPLGDASALHPQVRDHEPAQALFGGDSGLDIYKRLIPQAHTHLNSHGLLALEIGFGQRDEIAALLADESQRWSDIAFLDDLQNIARVALAQRS